MAPSLETSPKAKRSHRVAPASVSGEQRDFSVTELTAGVLELNAKSEAQAASAQLPTTPSTTTRNAWNRCGGSWCVSTRRWASSPLMFRHPTRTSRRRLGSNDAKLKKDLCELESTITVHRAAIPEFRKEVKGAIAQVTELIAKASSGQSAGVSLNVPTAALESRFHRLQEHTDNSLKGLEKIVL